MKRKEGIQATAKSISLSRFIDGVTISQKSSDFVLFLSVYLYFSELSERAKS